MGIEIERKFLLKNDDWKQQVSETHIIKQGYLQSGLEKSQKSSVRIRVSDQRANLNIKRVDLTMVRQEYEYEIPLPDAEHMLATLCGDVVIEKTRYEVPYGAHTFEVDEFHGANEGLTIAEVELENERETHASPNWLGKEVTGIIKYYNSQLSRNPYLNWDKK